MPPSAPPPKPRRPSRHVRQLALFARMQGAFDGFRFWHDGRNWKFENWPKINGRHASTQVICAHLEGVVRQAFDDPRPRERRPMRDDGSMAPYRSTSEL